MANDLMILPEELKAIETLAKYAVESKYFQAQGGLAGATCIAMYARELNLPVMHCLMGGMRNVQGKIEISPQMMNSMIRKVGHILDIFEMSPNKCSIKGTRKDTGESLTVTFTIEDAKRAKIYKGAWETYPEDMCFKSALSRIARRLFTDVIGTAYIEGEIVEDEKPKSKSEPYKEPVVEKKFKEDIQEAEIVEQPKITRPQVEEILSMVRDNEDILLGMLKWQGVENAEDILAANFDKVMAILKKKLKKEEVVE